MFGHDEGCTCGGCLRECLGRFFPILLRFLHKRGIEEDVALDAALEAGLEALRWIDDGSAADMSEKQRRGRLCQAARNIALNAYRKRGRGPLADAVPVEEHHAVVAPSDGDPLAADPTGGVCDLLRAAMEEVLSADERALVSLRVIDGLSFRDLAPLVDLAPGTVCRNVRNSLLRLRAYLARRGVGDFPG